MGTFLAWFRSSIIRRFFIVFFGIVVAVALVAIPAITLTSSMSSSGGAINVSGSMRMQSYKLAMAVLNPYQDDEVRQRNTITALNVFGDKLDDPSLADAMSMDSEDPIRQHYTILHERFNREIKPLALASLQEDEARRKFVQAIPSFVEDVNIYVKVLEESLNTRLLVLKWLLIGILIGSLILTYGMIIVMKRRIFYPLLEIGGVASAVRQGSLTVRAKVLENDEIGRLASGFNYMLDELSRLYGNLEAEVERKTLDLNRRNQGLELIGRIAEQVNFDEGRNEKLLGTIMDEIVKMTEAKSCALFAGERGAPYML
ncbi:MAG: type IV pili methyl-accepting chemotaxis transducer N-terminal domain-containing protein, partial [Sutterella sp.]